MDSLIVYNKYKVNLTHDRYFFGEFKGENDEGFLVFEDERRHTLVFVPLNSI